MSDSPRILCACKANGGRSVANKLLTQYYGGDSVEVFSASSEPGDHIHPEVADVLTALGLDVPGELPKGFDITATYDVVVTQGSGDTCPVYLGAKYSDWPLDDPKGQDEATVRRVVADIDTRMRALLTELKADHELPPSVFAKAPRLNVSTSIGTATASIQTLARCVTSPDRIVNIISRPMINPAM